MTCKAQSLVPCNVLLFIPVCQINSFQCFLNVGFYYSQSEHTPESKKVQKYRCLGIDRCLSIRGFVHPPKFSCFYSVCVCVSVRLALPRNQQLFCVLGRKHLISNDILHLVVEIIPYFIII